MKIALIQISTIEEQPEKNLKKIIDFSKKATEKGAGIIMFHEGTLTDYVSDVDKYAQEIPSGPACKAINQLANELSVYISFGLIEKDGLNRYITQVFLGPNNYLYKYRKTWLYPTADRIKKVRRHRDELSDFDPGNGPEIFEIAGLKASCMICADSAAQRCLKLIKQLSPQIVFFPNNREMSRPDEYWGSIAKSCDAPLLITNRVGISWGEKCEGGCSMYSKDGELIIGANKESKEEIVICDLSKLDL
ncbi:MAG TPA: carbon-nitrogen hydrolase family protein [Candidatus Yonathbacteria bacterium]|nr:carbon-nitrogen hydrolase family protein [Candidatus Yonathbacteria bacterium]